MADNTLQTGSANIAADDVTTLNGAGSSGVLVQRVKVGYGADGDFTDASTTNPLPISLRSLSYPASTANSTTTQLAAGATWTGTIEDIQNQQAAQVEVVCDQPYKLTVYQYIDVSGTQQSWAQSFTIAAGVPFMQNITLPGNYFRLVLQNLGAATTTTLVVNTTFGIMDTLPNTLTAKNNLRVSIDEVSGTATNGSVPVTLVGDTTQQIDVLDDIRDALIGASANNTLDKGRSLIDLSDPLGDEYVSRPVAPFGLEVPGEQPSAQSMPVALSQEQANDWFSTVDLRALPIGYNALTGNTKPLDTSKFASIYFLVTGTVSTGQYIVEGSMDGGLWHPIPFSGSLAGSTTPGGIAGHVAVATTIVAQAYFIPCSMRFIRMRVTTAFSGTLLMGHVRLSRFSLPTGMHYGPSVGFVAEGGTIGGNPVRVGGTDGTLIRTLRTTTTGVQFVTPDVSATGLTTIAINSAATTNATSIKASAGTLFNLVCSNTGAAAAFVKLYNKASAPTVGTDVPVITLSIPASGTVTILDALVGYRFSTGIALAITNLAADTDTTAVAAAQVKVIGMYA